MIAYTNLTALDAFNELNMRTRKYRNSYNYDWGSALKALNGAIADTASLAMPFKPNAYKRRLSVINGQDLGPNFVTRDRLYVYGQDNVMREARYADPKETFSVTDYDQNIVWATSLTDNPVYTIFGNRIYICENPIPDTDFIIDSTALGSFEGYYYPDEMTTETDIIVCPYEYMELIFLHALTRLYSKGENLDYISNVYKELEELIASLFDKQRTAEVNADATLESFITEVMLKRGFAFNSRKR